MSDQKMSRAPYIRLLILFALAVALKTAVLLTSQRMADGDEAIVGLMASHVLTQHQHPLFMYGQNYDAGAGIVAHLAVVPYTLGGVSSIALKLAPLLVWLLLNLVLMAFLWRWIGGQGALFGGALGLFSPTSVEWSLKARGGHMLAALAVVMVVALAVDLMRHDARRENERSLWRPAALGFCSALSVWLHPSAAPYSGIVALLVLALLLRRRQILHLALFVAAMGVTTAVFLWIQPGHAYWSWQALRGSGNGQSVGHLLGKVLPAFFTPDLDWSIPRASAWITLAGWMWLLTWVTSVLVLVWMALRRGLPELVGRSEAIMVVLCALSGVGTMFAVRGSVLSPYVLLPLYPLSCMMIAVAATCLCGRPVRRRVLTGLVVCLVAIGGLVHLPYLGAPMIHGAAEQNQKLPAAVITEMLHDLDRHQVRHVFSGSPMLQWNLIFESRETVLARSRMPRDRWQPYVTAVNRAFKEGRPVALLLVLNNDEGRIRTLEQLYAGEPGRLSLFDRRYALVYDPPREAIESQFQGIGETN